MTAFVFVPLLALAGVTGVVLAAWAAHLFLAVTQQTAAGNERIDWPDEPILDWLVGAVALLAQVATAAAPGGILALLVGRLAGPEPAALIAGFWFWLMFPLLLFALRGSSTDAGSAVRGELLWRLLQRPGQTLIFYAISLPTLLLAVCLPLGWVLGELPLAASLVLAPLAAAAWLVYGRMLGRLAYLLTSTRGLNPSRRRRAARPTRSRRGVVVVDPWAVPDEEVEPVRTVTPIYEDGSTGVYGVNTQAVAVDEPATPRPMLVDDEDGPPPGLAEQEPATPLPRQLVEPSETEMRLARRQRPKPPAWPWAGLLAFLVLGRTPAMWLALAVGLGLYGSLLTLLAMLRPI